MISEYGRYTGLRSGGTSGFGDIQGSKRVTERLHCRKVHIGKCHIKAKAYTWCHSAINLAIRNPFEVLYRAYKLVLLNRSDEAEPGTRSSEPVILYGIRRAHIPQYVEDSVLPRWTVYSNPGSVMSPAIFPMLFSDQLSHAKMR